MKRLMIISLALILCFMVGCQDKEAMAKLEDFRAQAEVEEQNKELMTRWFKEAYEGDLKNILESFATDYVSHWGEISWNLEEHKQAHDIFFNAFPDIKHEVNSLVAEGDRAIIRVTITGTHKGEHMGIPPTGNKISYTGMLEARFLEGKIAEVWGIADMLTLMQQLGMELKPKEGE